MSIFRPFSGRARAHKSIRSTNSVRRAVLETLEERRLMIASPWTAQPLDAWHDESVAPLVAEGEGELVSVSLEVKNVDGTALDSQQIQLGQVFQVIVSAQDLRDRPQGVFALYNDLHFSEHQNVQLAVGESQLLELSSNVNGGSFILSLGDTEVTVSVPANFNGTDAGKFPELASRIQNALSAALGADAMAVSVEIGAITPRFIINFRGDYLGADAPMLNADFSQLRASSGQPSGSVTDDFVPADPTNLQAFRYSALTYFLDGVRPSARYSADQPDVISSAGAVRGLGLPTTPGANTPFYGFHLRAVGTGTTIVTPSPGQVRPADDILMYPLVTVADSEVIFQPLTITIGTNDPAVDLGVISGPFQLPDQAISTPGAEMLYKFTTTSIGGSDNSTFIQFDHSAGDLDFEMLDADHNVIGRSASVTNKEEISLSGRPSGLYYLRVFGFGAATNSFSLTINAPLETIPQDSFEPNNQSQSASDLGTLQGVHEYGPLTINNSDDVDFFKFTTVATGGSEDSIRLNFVHARGDLDMQLLNADGVVVGSSKSIRDFEEISLKGLAAGSYKLQVYGYAGATNPRYSLRIRAPQESIAADRFEANNSREQAAVLQTVQGRAFFTGLSLHSETDQDWYRINLASRATGDHSVVVEFNHATSDLDVELYSSTGELLRASRGTSNSERINLAGLEQGNYFLHVFSFSSQKTPAYSIGLNLPSGDLIADAWEANQTQATATNLRTVHGTLELENLSIHNSTDVDWFRFETVNTGTQAHFAGLVFNDSLGDIDLELYDADGVFLRAASATSDTELVSLNQLEAGVYFLKINGYRQATNPRYSLSLVTPDLEIVPDRYEPNDVSPEATQLRTVSGQLTLSDLSIHQPGEDDIFQFSTVTDGNAEHAIVVEFAQALGDIDIELLTPDGVFIRSSAGVGNREVISLADLPAGSYELVIYGFQGSTNPNYTLSINAPELLSSPDRFEANNTRLTATNLRTVASQEFGGLSIHEAGDEDWFRFETNGTGNSDHSIDLSFIHSEGDIDVQLYDAAGTLIDSSESARNGESMPLVGRAAGVYYLRVYGYADAVNQAYRLTFHAPASQELLPDRFENNQSLATASQLRSSGDNLVGSLELSDLTISTASDVDFYQFTTVASGTAANVVTITYPRGSGGLKLELLNSAGQEVSSSNSGLGAESVSLDGQAAGRYYLKVSGGQAGVSNQYRMRIDAPNEASGGQLDAWTIMVYMTASDLAEFAFADINEMEQAVAGLPGSVNIAVLWDQSADETTYATGGGSQAAWSTLGRAFIQSDTNPESIATRFEVLPEASSGDANTLSSFLRWAAANAPAEHYAVIGWDHGAGLFGSNFDVADNATADYLQISEWHEALSQPDVPAVDLLAFDACLMAMAEVQYTLRDVTNIFVGSQEVVSGEGYDYNTLFQSLIAQPYAVSPSALASGFVQSYELLTAGQDGDWDTQSAVQAFGIEDLVAAIRTFSDATVGLTTAQLSVIAQAIGASISYSDPEFRDLGSIMNSIRSTADLPDALMQAANDVTGAISNMLVLLANDDRQSSGISIYTPDGGVVGQNYSSQYADFMTSSGWIDMLARVGPISSGRVIPGGRFGAAASTRDWAESNDIAADATNLHMLSGDGVVLDGLSLHDALDIDWYRFSIGVSGVAGNNISIAGTTAALRVDILDAAGVNVMASNGGTGSTVSLAGLTAGNYTLRIASAGAAVRSYELVTSAPMATGGNRLGDNSTAEKAYPLGIVGNQLTMPGLQVQGGGANWFSIETPRLPNPQWYSVEISSPGTANMMVQVLDDQGNVVSQASGSGKLILGYRASGGSEAYQLKVSNNGFTTTIYNLAINTLVGTITDVTVPERLIGVTIDQLPLNELVHQVGQVTVGDSRFEWADGALRLKTGQVLVEGAQHQVFIPITVADASQPGTNVSFVLPVLIESNAFAFHNTDAPLNVNDDINPRTGQAAITAIDALLIINEINSRGSRQLLNRNASAAGSDPFFDTNRDGFLSAIDALLVINFINSNPNGEGEAIQAAPEIREKRVWDEALADL